MSTASHLPRLRPDLHGHAWPLGDLDPKVAREDEIPAVRVRKHTAPRGLPSEAHAPDGQGYVKGPYDLVSVREPGAILGVPLAKALKADGRPTRPHDVILPGRVGGEQRAIARVRRNVVHGFELALFLQLLLPLLVLPLHHFEKLRRVERSDEQSDEQSDERSDEQSDERSETQ